MEESQSMMDASKIMLEPLMALEKVRVGFGSSLLEEAKSAARGTACALFMIPRACAQQCAVLPVSTG